MAGSIAADLIKIRDAVARKGAKAAADAMGAEFTRLTLPHVPVRSGALRRSIRTKPGGGGLISTSHTAPHTVYAAIQNYGGRITVKHTYTTSAGKTMPGWLSDGKAFFGHSVYIPGKNYWTLSGKEGAISAAAARAIQTIINGA